MPKLKLHTKTTLLASAITVSVIALLLWLVSVRVAQFLRDEQKTLAEVQASNLAEHISGLPAPREPEILTRAATLARGARPNVVSVRVWERAGGVFRPAAEAPDNLPAGEIPEETRAALRSGMDSRIVSVRPRGADDSLYRVFAPVTEGGRISGAVEIVEQLDNAPAVAVRLERTALWLALVAVALITLATSLMFRRFVYRPIDGLLAAMQRAEEGDLQVSAPVRAADELGSLSAGFNRMIERVRQMTEERAKQQRLLEERVRQATVELAERNSDLETTNLELWGTTRRLAELERLAAAGQTAAQVAHEVGTPLNLISGHVQLLQASLSADERAAARLQTISAQIERIERIVRGLLDRTRPEAIELIALDPRALLQHTLDLIAPLLAARRVRLIERFAADLPPIAGDAERLQGVLINLFNNAFDALPAAGGELHVSAGAVDDSRIAIEIADTGAGMTPEVRARAFDPLFTTKRHGRGTGLGLVIVRQVVREHGGDITLKSEPGQGTNVRITLPAMAENERAGFGATASLPANLKGQIGNEKDSDRR